MKRLVYTLKDTVTGKYYEEGFGSMPHVSTFDKAQILLSAKDATEAMEDVKSLFSYDLNMLPIYLRNRRELHPRLEDQYQKRLDRCKERKNLINFGILIESHEINSSDSQGISRSNSDHH